MQSLRYCLMLIIVCAFHQIEAQTTKEDSIKTERFEKVDIIEIPSRSALAIAQLNRIEKDMLQPDQLNILLESSKAKLAIIDSIYQTEQHIDLDILNHRHLVNNQTFWKQRKDQTEEIKAQLTEELDKVDLHRNKVQKTDEQWHFIAQSLGEATKDSVVNANIAKVYIYKEKLLKTLINQETSLLEVQDKAITELTNITILLESINQKINETEENLFTHSTISLKELFSKHDFKITLSEVKRNLKIEYHLLTSYLKEQRSKTLLLIVILLSGLFALRGIKKTMLLSEKGNNQSYYQLRFNKLLNNYYSTAFVIAIWISAFLYPNQPLLLQDITRGIICIPLSILLFSIVDRPLFTNLIILFAIVLIKIPVSFFPPNQIVYQGFMLLAAITQVVVLINIRSYLLSLNISGKLIRMLIGRLMLVAIITVSVIILMGLMGYNLLTEFIVNIISTNAFTVSLLFVSMLIANGMIEHLFETMRIKHLKVFEVYGTIFKKRLIHSIAFISVLLALYVILVSLNIDDEVISFIWDGLSHQFIISDTFSFSLIRLILLVIILTLSIFSANVIKTFLEEDILSRTRLGQGLPHTIALLGKYTIITIGVTMAVTFAGIPTNSLTVLIGAFGVGIGFGLQNIFNNLVSGLILLFERPIKIDDVVEVGQLLGRVKSIGIRSSIIRTFDGAEVIVPNGNLISNEVINWTHSDPQRRHEVLVGVAYGSDVEKVKQILEEQLHQHKDILKDPEPSVLFVNMGDSSLDFRLLFWISKVKEGVAIKSDVTQMIYAALTQAGIQIPFPQRDIHIISQPDKKPPVDE